MGYAQEQLPWPFEKYLALKTCVDKTSVSEMKDRWKAVWEFIHKSITKLIYLYKDRK